MLVRGPPSITDLRANSFPYARASSPKIVCRSFYHFYLYGVGIKLLQKRKKEEIIDGAGMAAVGIDSVVGMAAAVGFGNGVGAAGNLVGMVAGMARGRA